MNTIENFHYRVIDFLHNSFPDSQEMEPGELYNGVTYLLEKASSYGLTTEADQVNYVITGYLLGLNFDTEMPAATQILTDPYMSGTHKADWLQQWTQQIFEILESGQHQPTDNTSADEAAPENTEPADIQKNDHDMGQYLNMQAQAEPYHALAEEVVRQLILGDASALRTHFSLNFLNRIGIEMFEQVCADLLIPFFERADTLGQSSTVTYTTDSFGNRGFAFYRTIMEGAAEKPFIIYMVQENDRIVVANVVINKTYADMH